MRMNIVIRVKNVWWAIRTLLENGVMSGLAVILPEPEFQL